MIKEHILNNIAIYICTAVIMPLAYLGFLAMVDQRHEGAGEVKRSELRQLQRDIDQLETYQSLAPNSEYAASREQTIRNLQTNILEIERDLAK